MKFGIKKMIAIAASALLLAGCGSTQLSDTTVAKVNNYEVSKEYFEKSVAKIAEDNGFVMLYGEDVWSFEIEPGVTFRQRFSEQMLDIIVTQELVYQDAQGKKLVATDTEVQDEYDKYMEVVKKDEAYEKFLQDNGIDEAFIKEHLLKSLTYTKYSDAIMAEMVVSDEDIKAYYDANKETSYTNNQVKASHILISTRDESNQTLSDDKKAEKLKLAEEILARAKGGEDFAALAIEYSDDPGSGAAGGDLGYFSPGMMVPEFNDKAFSMSVGEISDIVETQFGYHIIYLTDKINETVPFDQVKGEISNQLKFEKYSEEMEKLRSSAKITINDKLLKELYEQK